ncbi:FAD-dependent oxidoreductase [Paraflavitalea speifideaquila]|uniref:FAD-dependent oxidoreductase n=1 Tax=Paraflavitalea speifideaquila TaxID=3076558 RepID=UPI0028E4419A|nr:FAD-dependent oxidoreductase [Paraflavitalea speifideiaquila]
MPGRIVGAAAKTGHLLRDGKIPGEPQSIGQAKVVIVGAGISGLSAARSLHRQDMKDFLVLDLEDHAGGNASSGANNVSHYPGGSLCAPAQ